MLNTFKKLAAQLLIVVFVVGSLTLTSAEAASLGVPGNPRFHKWRNTDYTSCYIRWNPVAGADYYEYYYCWTDGSHKVTRKRTEPTAGIQHPPLLLPGLRV